jgi:hypothetical protein
VKDGESWYGSDDPGWGFIGILLAILVTVTGVSYMFVNSTHTTSVATPPAQADENTHPWHKDIIATNFWVGQIIDTTTHDGSQEESAYDENWLQNYGGCDGVRDSHGVCQFEVRTVDNGFFPKQMTPKQNPFYLDVPLVDWTLKNKWVEMVGPNGQTCYGQIEDAGPAVYDDYKYVLGTDRPKSTKFNGAGMDVSPALHGCLGFIGGVMGASDKVDWRFVAREQVPEGPWTRIETR